MPETTTTWPEFKGETYSYVDARHRRPEAWRTVTVSGTFTDGTPWSREETKDVAPKGLGTWAWRCSPWSSGKRTWVYVLPNGYAIPVSDNYGKETPPPLPREGRREQAVCHCGPHKCSACGTPHYIELHGVADGFCTYCYNRG